MAAQAQTQAPIEWQEGDDQEVTITVYEMRAALWFYEMYHVQEEQIEILEQENISLTTENTNLIGEMSSLKTWVLIGSSAAGAIILTLGVLYALQ